MDSRISDCQSDEQNQRDAGYTIGFEAIGGRTYRIAGVIARAVGNHTRIPRIVFLDLKDDLHQVRADIGDLCEDAARHAQRGRAQRFADCKSDEARARKAARNEEQNAEHQEQFDADQQHPDAHAGLQRNVVAGIRLASKTCKRGARVRERIHADAKPRHQVTAADSDQAENQNDGHAVQLQMPQKIKIENDRRADKDFKDQQEFALREEIRLTCLVDQFGNLLHR